MDGSFSSVYTHSRPWSPISRYPDGPDLMITLTFDAKCQSLPPQKKQKKKPKSIGRLHHYFMDNLFSWCCQSKCQIQAEFPIVTEIFSGQTVALHQHLVPSPFRTIESCQWYKTPDISGVRYPKKRSQKKKKWEQDLVTGSLHHSSSESTGLEL